MHLEPQLVPFCAYSLGSCWCQYVGLHLLSILRMHIMAADCLSHFQKGAQVKSKPTDPRDLLDDPLFTVDEAARIVKLAPWTLRNLVFKGVLKGVKVRDRRMFGTTTRP